MRIRGQGLRSDQQGAVAVTLALSLLPLSLAAVGALDLQRALSARVQLQDALDAAALAGAGSVLPKTLPPSADDNAQLTAVASPALDQNLGVRSDLAVTSRTFRFDAATVGLVVGDASAEVQTVLGDLELGGRPLRVTAHSEVLRGQKNVETALVLDVTGSMAGQKLADLKVAAADLVRLIVQDQQIPFYSKVAVVPYSSGVNLGDLADDVRGTPKKGCTRYGCDSFTFDTATGGTKTFDVSTCVSERTGPDPYTDASFRTRPVGYNYPSPDNGCVPTTVRPLSSDKPAILGMIGDLQASGSTAGQIGLAWGWYAVSPNFAPLWASPDNRAAPYDAKKVLKVVVLMTDGMFNTAYKKGVISGDSPDESGSPSDHIEGTADNGDSFLQARALCDGIKAKGILLYTVGFDLKDQDAADAAASRDLMSYCATGPDFVYLPETGADLKSAFHAIGEDIAALRISR
jgi:Flp pilus assembly protein TadG